MIWSGSDLIWSVIWSDLGVISSGFWWSDLIWSWSGSDLIWSDLPPDLILIWSDLIWKWSDLWCDLRWYSWQSSKNFVDTQWVLVAGERLWLWSLLILQIWSDLILIWKWSDLEWSDLLPDLILIWSVIWSDLPTDLIWWIASPQFQLFPIFVFIVVWSIV